MYDVLDTDKDKLEGVQEHYEQLVKQGFYRGAFQSIELAWMSDDRKSVLDPLYLCESWEYKHDTFYHEYPAVLDGALQLIGFLIYQLLVT